MSGALKADLIIMLIIGLSVGLSFLRGFIKELISLLSWIIAIWLAILYCHDLSTYMTFTKVELLRVGVAFLLIFVPTVFLGAVINLAITSIVRKTPFSLPDRALGMVFGFFKAGLFLSLLVLVGTFTELPKEAWWKESTLIKPLEISASMIKSYVPEDLLNKKPKTAKN
jgi:membrane protein required for colicin V production